MHVRDAVGRTILRHQSYEPQLTDWLLSALSQGRAGLFIDVGANIGWFSLHAAGHPRVERVLAVEPDAGNLALLQAYIERNGLRGRIEPIGCALGAEAGTARLYQYKPSNRGRHSLIMDHGRGGSTVPVRCLDELLDAHGLSELPIAAMKVDVEGYEPLVLAGGREALSRTQILVMEFSPDLSRTGGLDLAGAVGLIEAEGFRPRTWDGEGTLPRFADLREGKGQVTVGFSR